MNHQPFLPLDILSKFYHPPEAARFQYTTKHHSVLGFDQTLEGQWSQAYRFVFLGQAALRLYQDNSISLLTEQLNTLEPRFVMVGTSISETTSVDGLEAFKAQFLALRSNIILVRRTTIVQR